MKHQPGPSATEISGGCNLGTLTFSMLQCVTCYTPETAVHLAASSWKLLSEWISMTALSEASNHHWLHWALKSAQQLSLNFPLTTIVRGELSNSWSVYEDPKRATCYKTTTTWLALSDSGYNIILASSDIIHIDALEQSLSQMAASALLQNNRFFE